jgi:hypothetical protein
MNSNEISFKLGRAESFIKKALRLLTNKFDRKTAEKMLLKDFDETYLKYFNRGD